MTEQEALWHSIGHWFENAQAASPDEAHIWNDSCALCTKYFEDLCKGCPVAERTKKINCRGSPWVEAGGRLLTWDIGNGEWFAIRFRQAAFAEAMFLLDLYQKKYGKERQNDVDPHGSITFPYMPN